MVKYNPTNSESRETNIKEKEKPISNQNRILGCSCHDINTEIVQKIQINVLYKTV